MAFVRLLVRLMRDKSVGRFIRGPPLGAGCQVPVRIVLWPGWVTVTPRL